MLYWRSRFLEQPVTEFCSVIKTNSTGPVGASADLLMTSDDLITQASKPSRRSLLTLSHGLCFHREAGELLPAV